MQRLEREYNWKAANEEVRKGGPKKPGGSQSWNSLQVIGFHKEECRKNRRNGHWSQKIQAALGQNQLEYIQLENQEKVEDV